jgi:hypothetical protein
VTETTTLDASGSEEAQAPHANLNAKARGERATELVGRLVQDLTEWEVASGKRKNARRTRLEKFNAAVAAFAADLLHARNDPEADGWLYRPMAKESFSGQAVSARDFRSILDAWNACSL